MLPAMFRPVKMLARGSVNSAHNREETPTPLGKGQGREDPPAYTEHRMRSMPDFPGGQLSLQRHQDFPRLVIQPFLEVTG